MNNSAKQKIINSVLYVFLALLAVTIMGITIDSLAAAANRKGPQHPETEAQTEKSGIKESVPERGAVIEDPIPRESEVIKETEQEEPVAAEPVFVLPVSGHISKGFDRETATYSLTMNDYRVHTGLDITAPVGTAVAACSDGTVCDVYDSLFMGKCVVIDHGSGLKSYYMNLSEELPDDIFTGMTVNAGQTIAGIGESAISECADAPHLHFEMRLNDLPVDPSEYIKDAVATSAQAEFEG